MAEQSRKQAIQTLLSTEQIHARVQALGAQITADYSASVEQGRELVVVPVLKGSFVFAADLVRGIDLPMTMEFLGVRSYGDETESSGVVQITHDLKRSVEGKDVLLVEDIVDTGLTMQYLLKNLATRNPASVKVASFLHKPARAKVEVPIDYLGFTIEDVFVVGYGLDHAQQHRNIPYLGVLENG